MAPPTCVLGWPTPSFPGCPGAPTPFPENGTLKAIRPFGVAVNPTSVNLFYGDEHALTLGASKVGNTTCLVEPTPVKTPACVSNPAIGCTNGTDPAGRPIYPALFITDISTDLTSRAGDWQCGGTPRQPTGVCGVWKPFIAGAKINDPAANGFTLGVGADPYPPLPDATCTCATSHHCSCAAEKYGAEVKWALAGLLDNNGNPLQSGHTYRIVVMVHDGDQNQSGGDVGEQCVNVFIP